MAVHGGADGLLPVRREPAEKKKAMAMLKSLVTDGDHMQGSERSEVTLEQKLKASKRIEGNSQPWPTIGQRTGLSINFDARVLTA